MEICRLRIHLAMCFRSLEGKRNEDEVASWSCLSSYIPHIYF
jgi:hypothetical protein